MKSADEPLEELFMMLTASLSDILDLVEVAVVMILCSQNFV